MCWYSSSSLGYKLYMKYAVDYGTKPVGIK
jgi:hypothetical protein